MRTPSIYDHHCKLIEEGLTPAHDSITYGLNYRSPLNRIKYFHVANSQIPQDIMHVLLEGVIPLETRLLLQVFIYERKYFTLNFLNNRIENFSYGKVEARSKIPKRLESSHISSNGGKLRLSGMLVPCRK